jgi:hypothetical protein
MRMSFFTLMCFLNFPSQIIGKCKLYIVFDFLRNITNVFADHFNINIFRFEITGLTEEHLRDALPLKLVEEKILQILYNGESIGRARLDGGRARLLVGHSLEHDLDCLIMTYPNHLLRF